MRLVQGKCSLSASGVHARSIVDKRSRRMILGTDVRGWHIFARLLRTCLVPAVYRKQAKTRTARMGSAAFQFKKWSNHCLAELLQLAMQVRACALRTLISCQVKSRQSAHQAEQTDTNGCRVCYRVASVAAAADAVHPNTCVLMCEARYLSYIPLWWPTTMP